MKILYKIILLIISLLFTSCASTYIGYSRKELRKINCISSETKVRRYDRFIILDEKDYKKKAKELKKRNNNQLKL